MQRHVVFDFDGTLVDSLELLVRGYNQIAERRGLKLMTKETIAELRRLDPRARVKFLGVRWWQLPGLARELKRIWQRELPQLTAHPGIDALLAGLRARDVRVSIVSSNAAENIRAFAAHAGWAPFGDVRSSGLFGKDRTLRKYLRAHRLSAEQVIYVGDELRDAQACRNVNVRMIAVTWGADRRESFKDCQPLAFVDTPEEILTVLDGL